MYDIYGDFMEKYIGIIVAETQEMEAVKELMKNIETIVIYNLTIFKGKINNKNCLLAKCGVGKVNSARTTQILTDKFELEYVINLGSAGGLNDSLNIGDIVIAKKLVQHDFDVTAFSHEKGYIPSTGTFFECDLELLQKFRNTRIPEHKIIEGIISSGDIFCTDINMKEKIKNKFNSDCVEMEGASVAQVCFLNRIPFIVIRSISDKPNGKNNIDFNEYLKLASKNCAEILKQI